MVDSQVSPGRTEDEEDGQGQLGPMREAVDKLGRAIVAAERDHRPKDVISLAAVTSKLDVSRAMAREVLQVMHQKRLVKLQPRVGATVLPVEQWDAFDPDVIAWRLKVSPRLQMRSLTEVRQAIEPRAARLAAQRATADVCRDLLSLSHELQVLGLDKKFKLANDEGRDVRERYSEVDKLFHENILRGSGNEMFLDLTEPVATALEYRLAQDWAGEPDHREVSGSPSDTLAPFPRNPAKIALWLHRGVACAIEQGQPSAAEAFSIAVLAEIHTAGLNDPVLRFALKEAVKFIDFRGFTNKHEWEDFKKAVTKVIENGATEDDDEDGAR